VNLSDFEISVKLRARRLRVHTPPNTVEADEGVHVERAGRRRNVPEETSVGAVYRDPVIQQRVRGRLLGQ
jgi:hypothetical protein